MSEHIFLSSLCQQKMSRKIAESRCRFPQNDRSISGFFKPPVAAVRPFSNLTTKEELRG
jgi:hypothetical protein